MIVNTNVASLNAQKSLLGTNNAMQKSLEKLSSGSRINKAADDAAGLAMSEKMRGQIKGLNQAVRNAQSSISLIQTGEGALNETHSILQRMRELAVQSASDTNTADDRSKIQAEMDQLAKEISRISNTTEFNTQNLLAGGLNNTFHIGANKDQNIALSVNAMDAQSLGVAGSTVAVSGGVWGGATTHKIDGVQDPSRGLQSGTDYSITVDKTAAAVGVAAARTGGTGTETDTILAITNVSGFTGTTNTAFQVRIGAVSADAANNHVTSLMYSKDAGATWSTAAATNAGGFSTATIDGIEVSLADAVTERYAVGDSYTFTANAASATLQLQKGGVDIGTTTSVAYGSTNATVGNSGADQTIRANFAFSALADGTTAMFNIAASASTAATTSGGLVTVAADTKAGINVSTQTAANNAISTIDDAINTVSEERSKLGAMQNRLDHTINNLQTASENMTSAESRIRDVDMAAEMSAFTKSQILSQAGVAMLSQANQVPQAVLTLLG